MNTVDESLKNQSLFKLHEYLNNTLERNTQLLNSVSSSLIDIEFINEIKSFSKCESVCLYFGKNLKDLKIVIQDDRLRDHEIYVEYKSPRKLFVSDVNLPTSTVLNREYKHLNDVIDTFRKFITELARYFDELDCIDRSCNVLEPVNATYKDSYRKIILGSRTWLHVEVTLEGYSRNIHLIGQSSDWYNKLHTALTNWDHDKNIVDNIVDLFDTSFHPQVSVNSQSKEELNKNIENSLECGICLCSDLPGVHSLPQPLCQNSTCGVFYHRNCLYQWLVTCAGNRPPAFGVANGECPSCQHPITCSEKGN